MGIDAKRSRWVAEGLSCVRKLVVLLAVAIVPSMLYIHRTRTGVSGIEDQQAVGTFTGSGFGGGGGE